MAYETAPARKSEAVFVTWNSFPARGFFFFRSLLGGKSNEPVSELSGSRFDGCFCCRLAVFIVQVDLHDGPSAMGPVASPLQKGHAVPSRFVHTDLRF